MALTSCPALGIILIANVFQLQVRMRLTEKSIATGLRREGFKLTPQRREVIAAISRARKHLTTQETHDRASKKMPSISLVTVYRTLDMMAKLGFLCKLNTSTGTSYLLQRPQGHHHHLICSVCGGVTPFTKCSIGKLEQKLYRETGFEAESHLLEFSGRCRNCTKIGAD
ncbi:Fur family transcriptional regulator [Chloroflexota bacterium]